MNTKSSKKAAHAKTNETTAPKLAVVPAPRERSLTIQAARDVLGITDAKPCEGRHLDDLSVGDLLARSIAWLEGPEQCVGEGMRQMATEMGVFYSALNDNTNTPTLDQMQHIVCAWEQRLRVLAAIHDRILNRADEMHAVTGEEATCLAVALNGKVQS